MSFALFISFFIIQFINCECYNSEFENCETCSDTECLECSENYGLDTNEGSETYGKCIPCQIIKCKTCSKSANKCDSCGEGTYLNLDEKSKTYGKCVSCLTHCAQCTNESICLSCFPGYGVDEKGQCSICNVSNCAKCSTDYNYCDSCDIDSGLGAFLGRCVKTIYTSCSKADPDDVFDCRVCADGYYLVYKSCYKCNTDNCRKCQNNKCTSCMPGYALNSRNQCVACGAHCDSCDAMTKICSRCENGYAPAGDSGSSRCQKSSVENCTRYIRVNQCIYCASNYGVDEIGDCVRCQVDNCLFCNSNYKSCNYCENGYGANSKGQCIKGNIPNCQLINNYNYSRCSTCENGYGHVSEEKCVKCSDPNCDYCNDNYTYCSSCKEGFRVKSGKCYACKVENCAKCYDNLDECNYCKQGYLKEDGKCKKCLLNNCGECSLGVSACESCADSYGFNLIKDHENFGKCVKCSINGCKSCNYDLAICDSCLNGYKLVNNECVGSTNDKKSKGLSTGVLIAIIVSCVVVVGIIIGVSVYCIVSRKKISVDASSSP